ncbi:MAG: hypothetical protein KDD67_09710 [Ignavibacteriae bacterium]|nr:hypothetical protein [Ignavibacteriota bacterium]
MSTNLTNSTSLVGRTEAVGNYKILAYRNPIVPDTLTIALEVYTGSAWVPIDEINDVSINNPKWNYYENKTLVPIIDSPSDEVLIECQYSLFIKILSETLNEVKLAVNGNVTTKFLVVGELTVGIDDPKPKTLTHPN